MKKLNFLALILSLAPVVYGQSGSNSTSPVGPAPIEITQGDVLVLNPTGMPGAGFTNNLVYYLTYRMKLTDGAIKTFFQGPITMNSVNVGTPVTWALPAGWLLSVTVGQQNPVQRGQILTQVFVGKLISPIYNYIDYCLISTTMAGFQSVTWPMSHLQQSSDGPGILISYTVTNPATATNWTKTFLIGVRSKVVNIRFQLVTSATAGNRQVCIAFTDSAGNIYASKCAQALQPASQTNTYNFAVAVGSDFQGAAALVAIPNNDDITVALPFNLGWNDASVVASTVTGLQVGDQLQNIVIRTETWHDFT
jgi:hypothetical protein